jgi:4-alpha-glucanotransferase
VLRHAGGLRVDHVMGLFRLYWIPPGATADAGAYVRYPSEEILAVLAMECARAGAYVVGEDLGTVEPAVREGMERWGILGSKVLWFEKDPPSTFPSRTMASLSTHDLPTLAGLWSGRDEEEQKSLGLPVPPGSMRPVLDRLKSMAGISIKSDSREVARRVHRLLAESSSALLAASLDDALGSEVRPNLPGTTLERPNWRIPLPLPLEAIETHPGVREVATALDRRP